MAVSSSKRESLTAIKELLTKLRETDLKLGTDLVDKLLEEEESFEIVPESAEPGEQMQTLQSEVTRLEEELREKTEMCQNFERIIKEKESDLNNSMDDREKRRLQDENRDLRDQVNELENDIQRYRREKQQQARSYEDDLEREKNRIETLTNENDDLRASMKTLEVSNRDVNNQVESLNRQLQEMADEKESITQKLENSQQEYKQQESQDLNQELKETKTGLNKLMSSEMTDGNPDNAALSDHNPSDKLAERYQELYDNQWSDAFEALANICPQYSDKQKVVFLHGILKSTRTFCEDEATKQTLQLRKALYTGGSYRQKVEQLTDILVEKVSLLTELLQSSRSDSTCEMYKRGFKRWATWALDNGSKTRIDKPLPDAMKKLLKEMKKAMIPNNKDVVAQNFLMAINQRSRNKVDRKEVRPFVEECIHVCWIMAMSDPPIVLGPELKQGDMIDYNFYRSYTTKGSRVNHEVWPPLLVNVDGDLLTKGVVEAIGGSGGRADKVINKPKNSPVSRPQTTPPGEQLNVLDTGENRIDNVLDAKPRASRSNNQPNISGAFVATSPNAQSGFNPSTLRNYEQLGPVDTDFS